MPQGSRAADQVKGGKMKQYILIDVKGYGWLCRLEIDGTEVYRGEFQTSYYGAMEHAFEWEERRNA